MKINLIANLNGALMGLSFDAEREITLGREIGNTISPLTADGLSRHHAKLYFRDGTWYVEDLGSTNGTYLMGAKIEGPKPLAAKNVLQFGNFKLTVDELDSSAAPAPIAAPPPVAAAVPAAVPPPPAPAPVEKPLMTPAEAALAGAAAEMSENAEPAGVRRPTVPIKPGVRPLPAGIRKPTLPLPPKPAEPAPAVPSPLEPVAELTPVEPLEPLAPVDPLEPVAELTPVSPLDPVQSATPAKPVLRPGLKLPTQTGLKPGVKLPTQPSLKPGIKLPTKPVIKPGIKLPTKPSIKPAPNA